MPPPPPLRPCSRRARIASIVLLQSGWSRATAKRMRRAVAARTLGSDSRLARDLPSRDTSTRSGRCLRRTVMDTMIKWGGLQSRYYGHSCKMCFGESLPSIRFPHGFSAAHSSNRRVSRKQLANGNPPNTLLCKNALMLRASHHRLRRNVGVRWSHGLGEAYDVRWCVLGANTPPLLA
jgi:hypothetical protein